MGYEDNCLGIAFHISLQPLNRINIQMVGRLIQQQDIRLAQQQLHKCQPCLLSTGKRRNRALEVILLKPEFCENRHHFTAIGIAAQFFKALLYIRIGIQHSFTVVAAHFFTQLLQPFTNRLHLFKGLLHLFFHNDILIREGRLCQITDPQFIFLMNFSGIQYFRFRNHPQQRCLSAAVSSDNGDFLSISYFKLYVFKYGCCTVIFASFMNLIFHHLHLLLLDS